MDFNEDDVQYEDMNYDSGSGTSDILSSLFDSAASVGSAYLYSQTPQQVPTSPYGTINPSTGRPYAAPASAQSPLLMLGVLGLVGFVAYKALVK